MEEVYNGLPANARIKLKLPARTADSRVGGRNAARNMHAQNNITNQGGRQVRIQHILDGVIHVVLQGGAAAQYAEMKGRMKSSTYSGSASTAPERGSWKPTR